MQLKCFYTNVDSLLGKFEEFRNRVHEYHIIGIVETWLTEDINDAELIIPGYELYRKDRRKGKGSGIILYMKETLTSDLCDSLTNSAFEKSLWCRVQTSSSKGKLLVGVCYRCPSSSSENNANLLELLDLASKQSSCSHLLVMGDFHYPGINYRDNVVEGEPNSEASKFFFKTEDLFLVQCITEATRARGTNKPSILDYVFVDEENLVDSISYESPIGKSDHVCLTWTMTLAVHKTDKNHDFKLNYWKGNYEDILDGLRECDWVMEFKDGTLEHNWTFFKNKVLELVKEHVPLKKPYSGKKSAEWMTKETKRLIKTRNEAWTKYRQYSSQRNYARYKQLRNQTVQSVRNDHENYRKKVIRSFKGTPKKFFGYMRSFQTVKQKVSKLLDKKGELSETDQEAAEVLCEFFQEVFVTDKEDSKDIQLAEKEMEKIPVCFHRDKVKDMLLSLKTDKSPGPDSIHPMV